MKKAIFLRPKLPLSHSHLVLRDMTPDHYNHYASVSGALGVTTTNLFDVLIADLWPAVGPRR